MLSILDNGKFHDRIKAGLAAKLTDWFHQPQLMTNMRKSLHRVLTEDEYEFKARIQKMMWEVAQEAHGA